MGKLKKLGAMLLAMMIILSDGSFADVAKAATGAIDTGRATATSTLKVHFKNTSWGDATKYIYAYTADSSEKTITSTWPGDKLTQDNAQGEGWYSYENTSYSSARVMFNTGNGSSYRDPSDGQPGFLVEGESWYLDGKWYDYNPEGNCGKVYVNYYDEDGNVIHDQTVMSGSDGTAYSVEAPVIDGYTVKKLSTNATGNYDENNDATVDIIYSVTSNGIVDINSVSPASKSNITLNQANTITASATSSTDGVYYKFVVTDPNGKQVDDILKYRKTTTYTLTPSIAGDYIVKVYAQAHNEESTTTLRTLTYTATEGGGDDKELTVNLSLNKSTITAKESVTMTATANGGSGNYTYKYEVANSALTSFVTINSGASNTCTWKSSTAGTRYLVVTVTDGAGKTAKSKQLLTIEPVISNISVNLSLAKTTIEPKTSVGMTATVTGGTGKITYKYQVANEALTSYVTIATGTANTCTWKSSTAGKRYLVVTVTDANGATATDKKLLTIKSATDLTASLNLANSTIEPKAAVTMTATVNGGSGTYKYTYKVWSEDLTKSVDIKALTSSNTCTWKSSTAGKRYLEVTVTDSEGNTASDKKLITIASSVNEQMSVSLSLNNATIAAKGTVTMTATAKGGDGNYKYKYEVANTSLTAFVTIGSGSSNTCTWKSSAAGKRYLVVTVTDGNGNTATNKQLLTIN